MYFQENRYRTCPLHTFPGLNYRSSSILSRTHEGHFEFRIQQISYIEIPNRGDAHSEHVLQDCRLTSLSIRDFDKSDIQKLICKTLHYCNCILWVMGQKIHQQIKEQQTPFKSYLKLGDRFPRIDRNTLYFLTTHELPLGQKQIIKRYC